MASRRDVPSGAEPRKPPAPDPAQPQAATSVDRDETYRSIFERSGVVKLLIDPAQARIVDANEAACQYYGWPREALRDQPVASISATPPERLAQDLATANREGTIHVVTRHRMAGGELRDVEIYATAIQVEGRTVLYSIVHDVTERREAERTIRHQADLLQNVSDAVISTDLDFVVQTWNRAAEEVYGWTAQEAIGRPVRQLLGQGLSEQEVVEASHRLLHHGIWQGEVAHRHQDGTPIAIFSSVTLMRDEAGRPVGAVAVNRDVTSRRQVEEQLRQRITLEQLVAHISADFIHRPLAEIDAGIEATLGSLGEYADADRAELFLLAAGEPAMLVRHHSWVSPAAPASPPRRDEIPVDALPWASEVLSLREPIIVRRLADMPEDAAAERALLQAFGIEAIVGVPLKREDATIGLLTLESGRRETLWDEQTRELLGFVGDIFSSALDRKWRELALEQSEARFRQLVEATPVIPFEMDLESLAFTYVGPQFSRLLGFTEADWRVPGFWMERVHPDDREAVRGRLVEAAAHAGTDFQAEFRALARDERVIWFHSVVTVATGQGQRPVLRGFLLDITDRRQAEEAYEQLVEHSLQGLIIIQDGQVAFANRAAARIVGYSVEEIKTLGLPHLMARVLPPGRLFGQESDAGPSLGARPDPTLAYPIVTPQGAERWLELSTNAIELRGRPALQIMLVDVTARRQAEETLRQAQKMESLGILAGGVAHDFNNLLVAMLGQASLARHKLAEDAPAAPHIDKVIRAAERAADLTRQMLAYSGQGQFEVRPLRLNQLIQENLHLFEVAMPKNVRLEAQLRESLPLIEADTGQMQQVIMNLILNGAEAIGEQSGTVRVWTALEEVAVGQADLMQFTGRPLAAGTYVVLGVEDDGSGMEPATISRIFDPFFTTKFTGRGLGLAAVLGIVRAHAGGLTVDSQPDKGTTFRLYFPMAPDQPEPPPPSSPGASDARGLVLVIDDEEGVREAVSEILDLDGWKVMAAADGTAGLELFRRHVSEVRLVLLDLSMPGLSGRETFAGLQAIRPDVPVLLCSGYSRDEAVSRFAQLAPTGFLQKPFSTRQLIDVVRRHVNG